MADAPETVQPDSYDGKYKDRANDLPEDSKLPTGNMPKAPDPSPFTLGPMAPGGR
jgi:hypothetical protein